MILLSVQIMEGVFGIFLGSRNTYVSICIYMSAYLILFQLFKMVESELSFPPLLGYE